MTVKVDPLRHTRMALARTMSILLDKPPPQLCTFCLGSTMKKPWKPYCSACDGTGFGSIDLDVLLALNNEEEGNDEMDRGTEDFDLETHLLRQRKFSEKTFGPGARTLGVIKHIRKELTEIEADPTDIMEWVDVIILGFDGAWRAGWEPKDVIAAMVAKQTKNEGRSWPDWRTVSADEAIEHVRGTDVNDS